MNIEQFALERVEEELAITKRLKLVLQRLSHNKKDGKHLRELAQEALNGTRIYEQQLFSERNQKKETVGLERTSGLEQLTKDSQGAI